MSKRNRPRLEYSTRPDESLSVPPNEPLAERKPPWEPTYPCPSCFLGYGGVGLVTHSLKTVVYLRCNNCTFTWAASRQFDTQMINCKRS